METYKKYLFRRQFDEHPVVVIFDNRQDLKKFCLFLDSFEFQFRGGTPASVLCKQAMELGLNINYVYIRQRLAWSGHPDESNAQKVYTIKRGFQEACRYFKDAWVQFSFSSYKDYAEYLKEKGFAIHTSPSPPVNYL